MAENSQPGRKLGPREFIGGFALMVMGFGAQSWSNGRDIPWGAQQTYGAVLFGVGLVAAAGACLWPAKRPEPALRVTRPRGLDCTSPWDLVGQASLLFRAWR